MARVAEAVVAQPRVRETMTITFNSVAAQRAQLAELEVVKDRIAGEFARVIGRRPAKPYTAALMASLTISVLTLTFQGWYEGRARPVGPIVDEILDALPGLVAGKSSRTRP